MMLEEGEWVTCRKCGKEVKATQDMKPWLSLSEVRGGQEHSPDYFCSWVCLKKWVDSATILEWAQMDEAYRDNQWKSKEEKAIRLSNNSEEL